MILVALLALALVWWALRAPYPASVAVVDGQSQGTAQTSTNQPGRTGTGTGAGAGASTGASTGASQTPARDVSIQITGFKALNPTVIPSMDYNLTGNVVGDTISIVGTAGEIVYLNQQPVNGGNTYTLNLRELTRADGATTAVGPGEYFLRIRDKQGNILTQSGFFTVRAGQGEAR